MTAEVVVRGLPGWHNSGLPLEKLYAKLVIELFMIELSERKTMEIKVDAEEMLQAGLQFGHKTSRIHPKIKPYLFGARNGINIFDLEKTSVKFREALEFISNLIADQKTLLMVGTKVQMKNLIKTTAQECDLSYISERWLGGTFTNFETVKKRIEYFKNLEAQKKSGELEKYTKKEQSKINKELGRLELKFGGVKDLARLPDAVFVADMKKDALCIKEARAKKIKIIAVADTNVDPTLADWPIPANDDAISSVKYILNKVKEVVLASKSLPAAKEEISKEEK